MREGYPLPFRIRPRLTRYPTVVSCFVNPHRDSYLMEALHQLIDKNAVELVQNQRSLGFFNWLFLVPKPNNKWRPILDLSKLNLFLKVEKFKMETPETIRSSLQQGEWVTSIDFQDAYFHIPIQEQSRKYLRFHVRGRTYQFKALPFGLSTAPLEFTVVAKEVKLMATHKGIRIHQYLDDWLVRAKSHQVCLQHTQALVQMCRDLGWVVNLEKSELIPKEIFNFEISCPRSDISVQGPSVRPIHSTLGVYCGRKGSETDGHTQGYKDPPVPRRLVGESQIPPSLSPAYPSSSANVPRPWLGGQFREIRTDPKTNLQLCGLPVQPPVRPGPTHTGPVAESTGKDTVTAGTTDMSGPAGHVPDRITDCHRKASTPRSVTYEAHPGTSKTTGGYQNHWRR